jgi:hypothetical protein
LSTEKLHFLKKKSLAPKLPKVCSEDFLMLTASYGARLLVQELGTKDEARGMPGIHLFC